jgi:hypothetical protein
MYLGKVSGIYSATFEGTYKYLVSCTYPIFTGLQCGRPMVIIEFDISPRQLNKEEKSDLLH